MALGLALSDTDSITATLRDRIFQVVRFTSGEATPPTRLSIILAVPVARAYARRPAFAGRKILITLMGLPVVMPVIVAVFGIRGVYGRSGLLNFLLQPTGISMSFELYGLMTFCWPTLSLTCRWRWYCCCRLGSDHQRKLAHRQHAWDVEHPTLSIYRMACS